MPISSPTVQLLTGGQMQSWEDLWPYLDKFAQAVAPPNEGQMFDEVRPDAALVQAAKAAGRHVGQIPKAARQLSNDPAIPEIKAFMEAAAGIPQEHEFLKPATARQRLPVEQPDYEAMANEAFTSGRPLVSAYYHPISGQPAAGSAGKLFEDLPGDAQVQAGRMGFLPGSYVTTRDVLNRMGQFPVPESEINALLGDDSVRDMMIEKRANDIYEAAQPRLKGIAPDMARRYRPLRNADEMAAGMLAGTENVPSVAAYEHAMSMGNAVPTSRKGAAFQSALARDKAIRMKKELDRENMLANVDAKAMAAWDAVNARRGEKQRSQNSLAITPEEQERLNNSSITRRELRNLSPQETKKFLELQETQGDDRAYRYVDAKMKQQAGRAESERRQAERGERKEAVRAQQQLAAADEAKARRERMAERKAVQQAGGDLADPLQVYAAARKSGATDKEALQLATLQQNRNTTIQEFKQRQVEHQDNKDYRNSALALSREVEKGKLDHLTESEKNRFAVAMSEINAKLKMSTDENTTQALVAGMGVLGQMYGIDMNAATANLDRQSRERIALGNQKATVESATIQAGGQRTRENKETAERLRTTANAAGDPNLYKTANDLESGSITLDEALKAEHDVVLKAGVSNEVSSLPEGASPHEQATSAYNARRKFGITPSEARNQSLKDINQNLPKEIDAFRDVVEFQDEFLLPTGIKEEYADAFQKLHDIYSDPTARLSEKSEALQAFKKFYEKPDKLIAAYLWAKENHPEMIKNLKSWWRFGD